MSKFFKEELDKVNLPIEQIDKTHYHIPKIDENYKPFVVGKSYLIKIADYITNPPSNFTLQDNWNNGVIPTVNTLKVDVISTVGKMYQVNALGIDLNEDFTYNITSEMYNGLWLPEGGMHKIKEL